MSTAEAVAILVIGLVAWEALIWALKREFLGIALFRLRMRLRRHLPVGRYRWSGDNSIAVGKPDSVVVFRMPLAASPGERARKHFAITDESTAFRVGEGVVAVDPFLEAYDAELGPLVVQVDEPGRIASIGIDTEARNQQSSVD